MYRNLQFYTWTLGPVLHVATFIFVSDNTILLSLVVVVMEILGVGGMVRMEWPRRSSVDPVSSIHSLLDTG